MSDDLIDFACSNLWRDFYYETGLTNHPSPNYISSRDRALIDALADNRDAFQTLLGGEAVLPLRPPPSRATPRPPSKPAPPTQEPTIRRL